jgi:hypothetical protein
MTRLGACLLGVILCCNSAVAQLKRDSWKLEPFPVHFTHSLADAPLSNSERAQVFSALDNKSVHESFTDQRRDVERATVMRSLVGSIALARNGSQQVLVEGPPDWCGARTQCIRIFVRQGGQLRLVFDSWATGFSVRASSHNGFRDIGTGTIWSAEETEYRDYRWDGAKYQQVDCYRKIAPQMGGVPDRRPTIAECR